MSEIFFNKMVTKGLEPIESDGRFFEGYLTVEVKDKQGEVTIVDELYKVLPIWMDRGAPITDTHSNRVVGKGINFSRAKYTDVDGEIYPAIKVTGKIYDDYELDNEIWRKIKSGEYKGLSFGGSTKTDRQPMRMKDGSIAYSLSKLEHYEVAVCKDPAVPLAVITDINPIAKANMNCDNTGCYVTKPILGEPNFEAATSKVMEESNVPEANAKRIVGAAEANAKRNSKEAAVICKDCGLPKICKDCHLSHEGSCADEWKKSKKKKIKKSDTCPTCGQNKYGQHTFVHDRMYDDIDNEGRYYKHDDKSGMHHRVYTFNDATHYSKRTAPYEEAGAENYHNQTPKHTLHDIETHPDFKSHPSYPAHQKFLKEWKTHPMNPKNRKKVKKVHKLEQAKEAIDEHIKEMKKTKQPFRYSDEPDRQRKKPKKKKVTYKLIKEGTFKALINTNRLLGKYQGNILRLSRVLDKDATRETFRTTNIPSKGEGQSHGKQSDRARRGSYFDDSFHSDTPSKKLSRGKAPITTAHSDYNFPSENAAIRDAGDKESTRKLPKIGRAPKIASALMAWALYNKRKAKTKPSERIFFSHKLPTTSGKKKDPKPRKGRKGGSEIANRRAMETMSPEVKLNYQRNLDAMEAAAKKEDKKGKKKVKKVGSGSMIDPNQANQGAGFAIRNQTPPKRKKVRTMQAKLGDGTYDYSS